VKAPALIILLALALLSSAAAATASTLPPSAAPRQSAPFDIGVPAGDGYAPSSLALDASRNLAYVYHSTLSDGSAAISVVDLDAGEVERLLKVGVKSYGAPGRLLLTPDGKRLLLHEIGQNTVSAVDPQTGAAKKLLDGVRDIALSENGKLLFAAGEKSLAAYPLPDLLAGKTRPAWQSAAAFNRLAINGGRLLAAAYAEARPLVAYDARTGTQLATAPTPGDLNAFAAGPDGGWGFVVAGENPRLIRYDAALKPVGETPIPYMSHLSFDAGTNRFLAGGWRYDENDTRGHGVMLAISGGDGQIINETRWSTTSPPNVFTPWGDDALLAFSKDGPSVLFILGSEDFALTADIPMGVRAIDAAVDGAKALYVADDLGRIHVLSLPDGKEVALWQGGAPIALDSANGRLYANRGERVVALDLRDGTIAAEFPQTGHPAPDPNRDLVYIAERGVTMYDRSGKKVGDLPSSFPDPEGFSPNPYAYAAQVNPVTGHVAVVLHNGIPGSNGGSFLRIYEPQSDKFALPPAPHSFVMDVISDRKGNWYVAYSPTRGQEAIQALSADGKELRRLDRRTGFLALDERSDNLYLFYEGKATRVAASTLTAIEAYGAPKFSGGLAYSPEGSSVYLIDSAGPIITPARVSALQPLDNSLVAAQPSDEAGNDSVSVVADGRKRLVFARFGEAYRSAEGKTWQRLLSGAGITYGYTTVVAPSTVFITGMSSAGGEGVWRSVDAGATWEWLTGGLTNLAPTGPVLARSADEAYIFNRTQGLLRWDAAARAWQVAAPAAGGEWSSLTLAPNGALFRSNSGRLETSSDRGATWARLGSTDETGEIIGFTALYTVTQGIFSAVKSDFRYSGIQRSTDGGKTWELSLAEGQLKFDGYTPQIATGFGRTYLLVQPYESEPSLLRTTDYGDTWQIAPAGTVKGVERIAVDPLDGRLWLGARGGVRQLAPDKLRWQAVKPLPAGTERGVATPAPTPAATPTVGPCASPLTPEEAEINARSLGLGCPRGPNETVTVARQRLEGGQMIWREDRRWIYALYNDGTWGGFSDLWQEGDPADDPALTPPAERYQATRGFGKVWRENLGGPNGRLGWALEQEQGMQAQAQDWDYGTVLRFGGEVIVLQSIGTWR
jgi:DNA-binding beta-propeller fold protein YncE